MTTDTKTALLDVAEQAARSRGFDGFSYGDLAEAVGIRKASIHYHFPTKADLSAALMERYSETISEMCRDIETAHGTASGRLQGLIDLYRMALNGGTTLCLCVSLTTSHQSLSDEVNKKILAFRLMMIDWIESVFALGAKDKTISAVGHPDLEARATLALLEGAHLAARAAEDLTMFDQAVSVLSNRLAAAAK